MKEYKIIGTKYWKPHFNDFKTLDRVSLVDLLYRIKATFNEWPENKTTIIPSFSEECFIG